MYADAGLLVDGPGAAWTGAAGESDGGGGAARPSRAALSASALALRASLSSWILRLMASLAATSAAFSRLFFSASLICSFFWSSSFASCVSLVDFRRISSFRFFSCLSTSDSPARLAAARSRSSLMRACFCSSVRGAISSVDSAKSVWPDFPAWNSACAWLRNFLEHSLQIRLAAVGSSVASPVLEEGAAAAMEALISSRGVSWFLSSQSTAPWTV